MIPQSLRMTLCGVATALALAAPGIAHACGPHIDISFTESAPKDIFDIRNKSEETWTLVSLMLDLNPSAGGLIFDTEVGGAGENVAQPFELGAGTARLVTMPAVSDGDAVLLMLFSDFAPGQSFTFTIDLDDRLVNSDMGQTMISGGEITGTRAVGILKTKEGREIEATGIFDEDSAARLTALSCV